MSSDGADPPTSSGEATAGARNPGRLGRVVGDALRLAWQANPRGLVLAIALQVVGASATTLLVVVTQLGLDAVLGVERGSLEIGRLVLVVVLVAAVTALGSAAGALQQQQQRLLADEVSGFAWARVLDVTGRIELELHESPRFHDQLQRLRTDALSRPITMVTSVLGLVGGIVGAVGMVVVLLAIDPLLVPVLVLGGVPAVLLSRSAGRLESRFAHAVSPLHQARDYLRDVLTGRDEAKEVRAFGAAPVLRARHDAQASDCHARLRRHVRVRHCYSIAGVTGAAIALGACMAILIWLLSTGRVGLAGAGAAVLAMRLLGVRLNQLFQSVGGLFASSVFVEDLHRFRDLALVADRPGSGTRPTLGETVSVDCVSYTYPGSAHPAIEDVSLEIGTGEVVAIIGENGSGKTTLAKVVAGLYPPTTGTIRWDGVDTAALDPSDVRQAVAVIFQDFIRYQLSALDNIGLGDPDDADNEIAARTAAQRAGAAEFLDELPNAYSTILSTTHHGQDLSLGQWQRVALARALRRDAPLVILDEPSSALDPRAEQALFADVKATLDGRSALLISHRYSTVRTADRIYVMQHGRVVESGSHESLIATGGLYAELFSLQASAYR